MNEYQELWWHQSKSDFDVFVALRKEGFAQCHLLQHLQMATKKIAKAYFWHTGSAPSKSHAGFVLLLRLLGSQIPSSDRARIAKLLHFSRYIDFQSWMYSALPIAYELERVSPDLANDGPNPEYPWPHAAPQAAPADHEFAVWNSLTSGQGRNLLKIIRIAIEHFPQFADT